MIQSLFTAIDRIWLSKECLEKLPSKIEDLKLVKLTERFFSQVDSNGVFASKESSNTKLYLLNQKTGRLYRPFSKEMMDYVKGLEENKQLTLDSGKVIDLQSELGWVCLKIMMTSLAEIPARMLKVVFYTAYSICYNFWNFEIPFALSSSCATFGAATFDFVRVPYYGLGILLASIQGVLFDPIKGFFKLEEMELELNNHVKKDNDFFSLFRNEKTEHTIVETDSGFRLWYSDQRLIHECNLEDTVLNPEVKDISRFCEREELVSKKRLTPDVFPFMDYSIHSTKQASLLALDRMLQTGRKIYAFTCDQFFLAYTTGKEGIMPYFRVGVVAC